MRYDPAPPATVPHAATHYAAPRGGQVTDAAQRSPGGQLYWRDVVLLAQAYRRADQPELWALLQVSIR